MATIKQREAVKKTLENHGNVSKAMLEVGYSPNTAKNPKILTDSKGWQELMDKYLPDKDLAKVHRQGLKATKETKFPDYAVRHKYLETGYKIKGRLKESEQGSQTLILIAAQESIDRYAIKEIE